MRKGGKLPVDLVKMAKNAISPVLRLFPFCSFLRVVHRTQEIGFSDPKGSLKR
jgi:hypothetical protein